ncbi:N-acetylglucosamine kinase [Cohnella fermenti]|uniref:ATPase n=1 Tax=Cohnella fermenti TaxID=2565925 RepID=A0A4S4BQ89_9BACL|nr:BadF/BadG/BcrA/BcrD ATPase family protein [Cohnella fermenti]THF77082.1 ATPase [Cohnella fermenti]
MNYYLGVDGGGSKTYALIVDEAGKVAGKGHSGNGNHQLGLETARRSIREAVEMALDRASLTKEQITFAYFGLSGADREADYRILRPMIGELGFPRCAINCDTVTALRAGTDRPYGVVLLCGTGTNSAGVNPAGTFFQCGGFSYAYGDFGGGGELCIEAFRSVIRSWDGREQPTALTELVLNDLGYDSVEAMYNDYLDHEKVPPLRLTKLLFEAAEQGDAVAISILERQGVELGKSATAIIKRLGMEQDEFDVVLAGSVIVRGKGEYIRSKVEQAVRAAAPKARLAKLTVEPVVGAVWLAVEATGIRLPKPIYDGLRSVSDYSLL